MLQYDHSGAMQLTRDGGDGADTAGVLWPPAMPHQICSKVLAEQLLYGKGEAELSVEERLVYSAVLPLGEQSRYQPLKQCQWKHSDDQDIDGDDHDVEHP